MRVETEPHPLYLPLACWFCLPSFLFLLAPLFRPLGDAGDALAILAVLATASAGPVFTLFALGIALVGHFTYRGRVHERFMWILLGLAVVANLVVIFTGGGSRLLH